MAKNEIAARHGLMQSPKTLVDVLNARARQQPDDLAFRYLLSGDADGPRVEWTYRELASRARQIASLAHELNAVGERALLLYPPGLEFIAGFLGCACAGVVAVPSYPHRTLSRLEAIARDCNARFVLTTRQFLKLSETLIRQMPALSEARWIATDHSAEAPESGWTSPPIKGDTLAFLQYTSGSTGSPKGVMVTHANLLHNERMIAQGFGTTRSDHVIGWLPLYHDMGLIGNVLHPLWLGASCTLMSPLAFLQRPMRWLEAISRFTGTVSGGPNFAFDLCVNKKKEIAGLDLSSWRIAFNGAEPVRKETLDRFASAYGDCGFRAHAFYPCYGLAEATLFVTGRKSSAPFHLTVMADALEQNLAARAPEDDSFARTLVSSGSSRSEETVLIVDPATQVVCPSGHVGEVWLSGPNVAGGYWGKAEESSNVFRARLKRGSEFGSFLRTGDLGFISDDELFITGRLKDLIIVRGRNLYPHDIEFTVHESVPAVRAGGCAAFSLEVESEETLAIVAELDLPSDESAEDVARAIRWAVTEAHSVHVHTVVLVKSKSIPKTSSGKLRRSACRQEFIAGNLPTILVSAMNAVFAPEVSNTSEFGWDELSLRDQLKAADCDSRLSLIEQLVKQKCARHLRIPADDEIDLSTAPAAIGLDSLMGLEVQADIESVLGLSLPDGFVWQHASLRSASREILAMCEVSQDAQSLIPELLTDKSLAVSSGQERMWFASRLAPRESPVYNVHFGLRMQGLLERDLLERSLNQLVVRHEILRAVFREPDGKLCQLIEPAQSVTLGFVDLQSFPPDDRDNQLRITAAAIAAEPFDLSAGPLVRFQLVKLQETEHVLLVTQHHIVTDGWSAMLFSRDLATVYRALAHSQTPEPPRGLPFAAYVAWERQYAPDLEADRVYWSRQLTGLPRLDLPGDSHPVRRSYRGKHLRMHIPGQLSDLLIKLGREAGCTPFVILVAAYAVLLHRYTGIDDVPIGSFFANRGRSEFRDTLGFLVNTLVLRCDLSGDPTFRELLKRVHKTAAEALLHGKLPFAEMVQLARQHQGGDDNPLFNTTFVLQTAPSDDIAVPGMHWNHMSWAPDGSVAGSAKFDLSLALEQTPQGFSGIFEYNTDLFEAETVERMMGHYEAILRSLAAEPDHALAALPLLGEAEREQLLVEWNRTAAEIPAGVCFPQLFAQQAARTPHAIAVEEPGRSLSYGELDHATNRLGHVLRRQGVGADVVVGLLMDRSVDLLISILAVFKAGGAYLPLDPAHPVARQSQVLKQSDVRHLIGARVYTAALEVEHALHVVHIEDLAELEPADLEPCLDTRPDQLAYVIYTSGSTGTPKGAMLEHRGMLNHLYAKVRDLQLTSNDTLAQTASQCFDISVWQLLAPLMVGGRVCIYSSGQAADPYQLLERTQETQVSVLEVVPAVLRAALEEIEQGRLEEPPLPGLRWLLLTGEALPAELVQRWLQRYPAVAVMNAYGPTECSDDVAHYRMGVAESAVSGYAPIGRPVMNTQLYVLDRGLQPAPVGVPGELYVGGMGVGRGYRQEPARTAQAFVPDPFVGGGGRLYRTGDVARWRRDGELEFLGRVDDQVKVRGYRIELGEIEAALEQQAEVEQAVVAAREERCGDKRLVGYVVCKQPIGGEQLRQRLQQRLPEYMVPTAWVQLERLPVTANGKIDRRALPAPEPEADGASRRMPETAVEVAVAEIWAEVLNLQAVSAEEDFFALGGHSLLATQVMARLRARFGVDLALRVLFEQPTVAGLATQVELAQQVATPAVPLLRRQARQGELPLSFAQKRLWFLDQLTPGEASYNVPGAARIEGPLNIEALRASLHEIVRRHEPLRTRFVDRNGEPQQIIEDNLVPELPVIELSGSDGEPEAATLRLARQQASRPFNLSTGPLLRTTLLRRAPQDHILLLTLHHIISDGWSLGVLVREMTVLYQAFSNGQPSPLPELRIQYLDFSAWQRDWLSGPVLEQQLSYWKGQLAGLESLDLPTDRPRTALQTNRGALYRLQVKPDVVQALHQFSRSEGATLYMVLLAAFQVLLHRYTGQTDIAVGSPIAGRQLAETEGLIGFFVNTLVMRADLSGGPGFREVLRQVKEVTLEAYAHQDVPFEKLVEAISPQRDLSRTPLFQVMFALQNMPEADLQLGGAKLETFEIDSGTAKFELTLMLEETGQGLRGVVEYNTDLFEAETVERMMGHYEAILRSLAAEPDHALAALPLLGEAEREQLLVEWNRTAAEIPAGVCFPQLFAQQAARTPHAIAVEEPGRSLSYGELDHATNRLGHVLRRQGVGADVVVGLLMDRSVDLLISILAVFKAGGAYLPLDPAHPVARQSQVLKQSDVRHLIGARVYTAALEVEHALHVVHIEDLAELEPADLEPCLDTRPDQLAYVIYTSGSTGTPKGAMLEHRGMLNHLYAKVRDLQLTSNDTLAQTASQCFDISVWQLLAPLMVGGRVCIYSSGQAADPYQLLERTQETQVSVLEVVPAVLRAALEEIEQGRLEEPPLPGLRWLLLTGEALPAELVQRWLQRYPAVAVMNAYGPTECSDDVAHYRMGVAESAVSGYAPIGRPVMNTQLYVLDRGLQPAPVGVPGELYVGGMGVGRGYRQEPARTAQAFVPDPFVGGGGRLYRTGDVARWRRDGELEFLGRVDDQVKVRGYRIELGEIEAALEQQAEVEQAVVAAREERCGDKRLVGYVVCKQPIGGEQLRQRLQQRLPEYMVPTAWVQLERLPVTANGKIDRRALPAPEPEADGASRRMPETAVEVAVAEIWAEVLNLQAVSAEEDFFALGGHSLLATQVMARLRARFGVDLALRVLFEQPTVAGLATQVELAQQVATPAVPLLRRQARQGELPLSFAQKRLWFLDQLTPGEASYNVPGAARIEGPLNIEALRASLHEIVRRHEPLRTRFVDRNGEPQQIIEDNLVPELPVIELSGSDGEPEAATLRLARQQASRPFNLSTGPLLRTTLLRRAPQDHILLLTLHHIISDGWSLGVLVREMTVLYQAFSNGQPSPLPELRIQYLDFSAWQRDWLSGPVLEQQLSYWKGQLAGLESLDLPTDRPRTALQTNRGALYRLQVKPDVVQALHQFSRSEGATLYMVLLAAFQVLLHRYTGQTDIAVGSPIAGRQLAETEGLIGFFVNTLVMRADLSGGPGFREVLRQVKEVTLEAYAHQDVPFEKLVEAISPQRDLSRTPLFQVMFALQNMPEADLQLGGAKLETFEIDSGTAKFELTLMLEETGQGLRGVAEYNTDLFEAETVERMMGHYEAILRSLAAEPDHALAALPLLGEAEREQLLVEWNRTAAEIPAGVCFPQLFAQQAARTPHAIAVEEPGRSLSYGELDHATNRLGHVLRRQGVGADVVVGLLMDRSVDLLISILAVFKAGGAYLPLDPAHPVARQSQVLKQSDVRHLIGARVYTAALEVEHALHVVHIEDLAELEPADLEPCLDTRPDQLAYVIYTSGSTGTPKGAMLEHRGMLNHLYAKVRDLQLTSNDTLAQTASQCFDISVWQLLAPLMVGGRVCIYSSGQAADPYQLLERTQETQVSVLEVVPAVLRAALEEIEQGRLEEPPLPGLRWLLLTGEALPAELVQRWLQRYPAVAVMNAYGPTECSDDVAHYRMGVAESAVSGYAPIGRPVMNTQLYVLDRGLQPAPVGVPGELYVGGMGVGRGYRQEPARTAQAFVPDPFVGGGGRLYRTGDVARWRRDGELEFLGRVDDQVKVRGYRIELGEIEAALEQQAEVEQAVVAAREERCGDKRLVGYVVCKQPIGGEQLRQRLQQRLPEYMVPTAWVQLERLPVTANGKIDRRALPAPEPEADGASRRMPETAVEVAVAEIWAEVLNLQAVSAEEDFFALGGHSLLATQVMARLRARFGVDLALRVLFEQPTVAGLATQVELAQQVATPAVPLLRRQARQPVRVAVRVG